MVKQKQVINGKFSDNEHVQVMLPDADNQIIVGFNDLVYCNYSDIHVNTFLNHSKKGAFFHGNIETWKDGEKTFVNHIFSLNKPYLVISLDLWSESFLLMGKGRGASINLLNFKKNNENGNVICGVQSHNPSCPPTDEASDEIIKLPIKNLSSILDLEEDAYCKILFQDNKISYLNVKGAEIINCPVLPTTNEEIIEKATKIEPIEYVPYLEGCSLYMHANPVNNLVKTVNENNKYEKCEASILNEEKINKDKEYDYYDYKPLIITIYRDYIEISNVQISVKVPCDNDDTNNYIITATITNHKITESMLDFNCDDYRLVPEVDVFDDNNKELENSANNNSGGVVKHKTLFSNFFRKRKQVVEES